MSLELERSGNQARVVLSGELTIYTVGETKAGLAEAMNGADEVEVDLASVTEIDTAGLQLMLIAKRNPDVQLRFVNHPPAVLRLVDLANLGAALGDPLIIAAAES